MFIRCKYSIIIIIIIIIIIVIVIVVEKYITGHR